jgi:putative PIN family toxin of toxin-antitoxin system
MRVVLDTNVLLAALMAPGGPPHQLFKAFLNDRFTLITSVAQLDEFSRVSRYPAIRPRINAAQAGTLVNSVRALAVALEELPAAHVSADPHDDYLFGMAAAGQADYLVTGDKAGVLALGKYEKTRVVTVRKMVAMLKL